MLVCMSNLDVSTSPWRTRLHALRQTKRRGRFYHATAATVLRSALLVCFMLLQVFLVFLDGLAGCNLFFFGQPDSFLSGVRVKIFTREVVSSVVWKYRTEWLGESPRTAWSRGGRLHVRLLLAKCSSCSCSGALFFSLSLEEQKRGPPVGFLGFFFSLRLIS